MTAAMNIALMGLGELGSRHAENLASRVPGARLSAIADVSPQRRQFAVDRYGCAAYADWQDALHHPGIDAVVIVTPSNMHAMISIAAAEAKKAVFCEKPMALSVEDCDAVAAAVARSGVQLQMGFMRRFDPAYAAARRQIEAGAIGEVKVYNCTSRDPGVEPAAGAASSGGIYFDSSIHDFDAARFLMGDEVAELYAKGRALVHGFLTETGNIDHTYVTLDFVRGGLGSIETSMNAFYGYDIRAEVIGTRGTLRIGYDRQTALTTYTPAGVTHDHVQHWLDRFADAYLLEMVDFVDCIRTQRPPRVTVEDGIRATALAVAAGESLQTGRPIRLA